jgi:CheY-like chemotaxis protein
MHAKPKILAVDDEEFNLDNINFYLTEAGYDVIGAEDGALALKKLEGAGPADVIVLDRFMPNMDGMEFLKIVKADRRYQGIPVVMQTAAASPEQVQQATLLDVYYYLTKPYDQSKLVFIVNSALRDGRKIKASS